MLLGSQDINWAAAISRLGIIRDPFQADSLSGRTDFGWTCQFFATGPLCSKSRQHGGLCPLSSWEEAGRQKPDSFCNLVPNLKNDMPSFLSSCVCEEWGRGFHRGVNTQKQGSLGDIVRAAFSGHRKE